MKHPLLPLLVALALLASTPAVSAEGDPWLGFRAGATLPAGELRDAAGPGLQASLLSTFTTGDNLELELDLAVHDWQASSLDEHFMWIAGPGTRLKVRAWQASVHIVRHAPRVRGLRPYAKGGFGATALWSRFSLPGNQLELDETTIGLNTDLGAGVMVDVTPTQRLGIGAMFQIIGAGADFGNVFSVGLQWMRASTAR